jgi:hypothetical protein
MINALLTFLVGKNSTKRKKVLQVLDSLSFNEKTGEFTAKSTTNDKNYTIIYSSKAKEYRCDCPALAYQEYRTFESLNDRNNLRKRFKCIHILACVIYKALNA